MLYPILGLAFGTIDATCNLLGQPPHEVGNEAAVLLPYTSTGGSAQGLLNTTTSTQHLSTRPVLALRLRGKVTFLYDLLTVLACHVALRPWRWLVQ
ncbi:hypothetical protein BDU57DRAFT_65083 [Ampelomyces quisqualis]|uniref:Uncharacterized protein n=1 Tax=Ampelomyces quisqualis TaxID=50730 RepID=A0A6A5R7M1_AMPQU|nr:hypothetical protein BDU57DRAFT_65083 [Ampelomyces quisqualis]